MEIGPENKIAYHQAYPKASNRESGAGWAWEFRHHGIRKFFRRAKRRKKSLRDHRSGVSL